MAGARVLRRADVAILPFAVLLYLSAYLDRGNMANARLQGLQEEVLDDKDTYYSIALSCFFITYIVFSVSPVFVSASAFFSGTTLLVQHT
jgi:hypothetical protein